MPTFNRGCLVLILISAWACAAGQLKGGVRLYDGEPRAVSDIAILAEYNEPNLYLIKIDGMPRRYGRETRDWNAAEGGICVELLPGEHTLEFKYYYRFDVLSSSVERSRQNQVVVFTAKPGTLYRPHANRDGDIWVASVREDGPIPPDFPRPNQVFVPK